MHLTVLQIIRDTIIGEKRNSFYWKFFVISSTEKQQIDRVHVWFIIEYTVHGKVFNISLIYNFWLLCCSFFLLKFFWTTLAWAWRWTWFDKSIGCCCWSWRWTLILCVGKKMKWRKLHLPAVYQWARFVRYCCDKDSLVL